MDCSEVKAQLVEAAFGLADDPAVKAHADTCASCGPALAGLADRRRALRSYGSRTPSPELHDRILRKVRAGRRRRLLLAVAAGLLLGVPGALAGGRPAAPDRVDGDFEVRQGDAWARASGGRPAVAGLEIRTGQGRARMTLGGRSEIDVHPGTQIAVRSIDPSGPIVLAQERGEAHYRVRPNSGAFEVRTPVASVHVQGTEFQILIKGDDPMKKGTVLGTTLAAVVGVSSGIVAVRNTQGEVRVAPGSTATATAKGAPRLLAESESRVRKLETERTAIARSVQEDLAQIQELDRREKELEIATPPPKKASKADSVRTAMSAGLRGSVREIARKAQKDLGLTDEQTARLEEMGFKHMGDFLNGILADAMTLDDVERLVSAEETVEKAVSDLLTAEQKEKLGKNPLPFASLGALSAVRGYEAPLKDLDPEIQARAKREMTRFFVAASIPTIRAQALEAGSESALLLDGIVSRYETRIKEIVPADRAAALGEIMRQFTAGARK